MSEFAGDVTLLRSGSQARLLLVASA